MKEFKNLETLEQKELAELFAVWLRKYTHEVICKVMERANEIINNEFAVKLLVELRDREQTETKEFENSIEMLLQSYDDFKEYNSHNHPLTHSGSYRDILYDMYIK